MKNLTNGLLALPFTVNLGAFNDHACKGCVLKEQAQAADEVTDIVGAFPEQHAAAIEAFFKDQGMARYQAIRAFCDARKMSVDQGMAMFFMSGFQDQLRYIDERRQAQHPLVRTAFALQLYRSLLMGTMIATMEEGAEYHGPDFDNDKAESLIGDITEHAFDAGLPCDLAAKIGLEGLSAVGGPDRGTKEPADPAPGLDDKLGALSGLSDDTRAQAFGFLSMMLDGVEDKTKRAELQAKLDRLKANLSAPAPAASVESTTEVGMIDLDGEPTPENIAEAIYAKSPDLRSRISLADLTTQIKASMGASKTGFHVIKIPKH